MPKTENKLDCCEYCNGTGTIVYDYYDPASFHGHGQNEQSCLCQYDECDCEYCSHLQEEDNQ